MATFPLHLRHIAEQANSDRCKKILAREIGVEQKPTPKDAGGDDRYRIPTIGLNRGAIPGSSPGAVR